MWRILIRILPIVVVSIMLSIFIVLAVLRYFYSDKLNELVDTETAEITLLIDHYLNNNLSKKEWMARFDHLQSISHKRISIKSIAELHSVPAEKLQRFMHGEVIPVIWMDWISINCDFAMRIADTDQMLYWRVEDSDEQDFIINIVNLIILGIILLIISVWVYLHWAELHRLMTATDKIGNGDFSARAREKKYSSSFPFARRINQMAAYIERLITGQRELIHSVSHELRTPISRLDFGLELLKQSTDNPRLLSRISDMEGDVAELNSLVEELLQLATVGQQYKKQLVEFDLTSVIRHSVYLVKYDKSRVHLTLHLPEERCDYVGDMRLLERVVNNLLSNATKYARQQICVALNKTTQHYILSVEDDGKGIPEVERQRIFEPFYRLEDNWDKTTQGYGLGLSMVQKIVQVHNGQVVIETSCLGGAKLVVYLPL